ncbi:hypothetical protein [Candidatus Chlamydia corallus]|uniref:hypothetical protein n=1 Tax=Candidatus Chlamydia corallus TaxID=2038470 RepID=UPI000C2FC054|nr:hypothetical protein [Candidatus Chlamydia corallus]
MLIKRYETADEFFDATANFPSIQCGYQFVRSREGSICVLPSFDLSLVILSVPEDVSCSPLKATAFTIITRVIESIPIVAAFYGIGRLCAVWCVKGFPGSTFTKIYHTFVAALQILGLGIITLILRILFTVFTLPIIFCWLRFAPDQLEDDTFNNDTFNEGIIANNAVFP